MHTRAFPPAPLARHLAGRSRNFNDQKHQRQPVAIEKTHNQDFFPSIIYRLFFVSVEGIFHVFSFPFFLFFACDSTSQDASGKEQHGGLVGNRTFLSSSPLFPPAIRKIVRYRHRVAEVHASSRRGPARTSTIIYICIYIFFIYIYLYIYIYICNIYIYIFNDLLVHPISHSINTYLSIAQTHRKHVNVCINCHDVFPPVLPTIYSRGIKFLFFFLRASMYDGVMYVYYARVCVYVCVCAWLKSPSARDKKPREIKRNKCHSESWYLCTRFNLFSFFPLDAFTLRLTRSFTRGKTSGSFEASFFTVIWHLLFIAPRVWHEFFLFPLYVVSTIESLSKDSKWISKFHGLQLYYIFITRNA